MKAVIFDLDGVIVDSMGLHDHLTTTMLKRYGIKITEKELNEKYAGVSSREIFKLLLKHKNLDFDFLYEKKCKKTMILAKKIQPIPGAIPLIKELKKNGFKLGIGSSSKRSFIQFILKHFNLTSYFETFIGIEDVKKGKPDPEIFLLTAKKLQVLPRYCTVIEDGKAGMLAAKKAKMKCIALVKEEDLRKTYPADKK